MTFQQKLTILLQRGWGFLLPLSVFALFGGILLSLIERGDVVLLVNGWHQPTADLFFRYATWLGDGLFWLVAFVLLTLWRWRYGLQAAAAGFFSALLVQGLKNVFRMERPSRVLAEYDLAFVQGVDVYGFMSFPSGHTGAAFTGFFLLAVWSGKPWAGFCCFVLAAIAGFSRIYLVQHFFLDVYAGALLGVCMASAVLLLWRGKHALLASKGPVK
ncbi:MAG: phosphatase PAP2 family protein [Bacteroidetes bacterium]|nr:phosphatase PAP2 family protein [Bacteroidota bacterium]